MQPNSQRAASSSGGVSGSAVRFQLRRGLLRASCAPQDGARRALLAQQQQAGGSACSL